MSCGFTVGRPHRWIMSVAPSITLAAITIFAWVAAILRANRYPGPCGVANPNIYFLPPFIRTVVYTSHTCCAHSSPCIETSPRPFVFTNDTSYSPASREYQRFNESTTWMQTDQFRLERTVHHAGQSLSGGHRSIKGSSRRWLFSPVTVLVGLEYVSLPLCSHYESIRFKAISEITPTKSVWHEKQLRTCLELLWYRWFGTVVKYTAILQKRPSCFEILTGGFKALHCVLCLFCEDRQTPLQHHTLQSERNQDGTGQKQCLKIQLSVPALSLRTPGQTFRWTHVSCIRTVQDTY